MKNKIFSTIITLFLTTSAGFCAQQTRTVAVHDLIIKFTIAMAGVIVASVVIWLGLAVYNKILAGKNISSFDNDVLKTPKTIDDAVKFFIKKNRLK